MTPADASKLIHDALPIVESVAESFIRKVPSHVDADAIRGAAREALVRAACDCDPERLEFFPGYCHRRVTGAMLDELRRLDPAHNRVGTRRVETKTVSLDDDVSGGETRGARVGGGEFAEGACARLDLRKALRRLSPLQRRILVETELGKRAREIGDELGIASNYVYWLRHDALERCREVMAA